MEEHMEQTATAKGGGWVYDEEGEMGDHLWAPRSKRTGKIPATLASHRRGPLHSTLGSKKHGAELCKNVRGWTVYSAILASGTIPSLNATTL
jgi:hypothetical protein